MKEIRRKELESGGERIRKTKNVSGRNKRKNQEMWKTVINIRLEKREGIKDRNGREIQERYSEIEKVLL